MRVVYLYGPPGVGKLTVGTALAEITGFRLFHNHLTVNLATAIFPRESPPWMQLIRQVRRDVFARATQEGVSLIYTGVYRGSAEQAAAIETMLEPVRAGGGSVAFVQLECERDELMRRVQSESRRQHDKLTDPQALLARFAMSPTLPFPPQLRLETTNLPPAEAAARIAAHYALPQA